MEARENEEESLRRAQLFEILAHPTRIMILRSLQSNPMGFAELKRELKIESSGNLQHHLGKLGDLVKQTEDGKYAITDDAKEALRLVSSIEQKSAPTHAVQVESRKTRLSLFGLAIVSSLVLVLAIYEYSLIMKSVPLFDTINLSEKTLTLFGEKYRYLLLTTAELQNGTSVAFHDAVFTYFSSGGLLIRPRNTTGGYVVFNGVTVEFPLGAQALNVSTTGFLLSYGRHFNVEFKDGEFELTPIMPWPSGLRGLYGIPAGYPSRALAFEIGPQTIILLVKSDG